MGSDLSVVRAARVSHAADWRAGVDTGSDANLIRYLWRNRHTTPFEAVTFTFEVKAPIFVIRQWHRHRTWSYNEVSARYTELPEEFYVPEKEKIGKQAAMNKQARELDPNFIGDELTDKRWAEIQAYEKFCAYAFDQYHELLAQGWPRELARMVLPMSTYTRMFATVNLLNLFRFIQLRKDEHAQWEMQQYARVLEDLIEPIVPECHTAFVNYPQ